MQCGAFQDMMSWPQALHVLTERLQSVTMPFGLPSRRCWMLYQISPFCKLSIVFVDRGVKSVGCCISLLKKQKMGFYLTRVFFLILLQVETIS